MNNAARKAKSDQRKKDAGLMRANIWVHPSEVGAVRKYARHRLLTRAILIKLGLIK